MKTVIDLLHTAASEHGDIPCLGCKIGTEWKTWSFKDTERLSSVFAAILVEMGFKRGDNLAILSEGRPQWVIGEYGILKANCTSVPLSTKLTKGEIVFRLDHSEAKVLLVSENNYQKAVEALEEVQSMPKVILISPRTPQLAEMIAKHPLPGGKQVIFYDDLIPQGEKLMEQGYQEKLAEIEKGIDTEDTVTISYTSGTTGNPKGIMLSHKNYLHNTINSMKLVQIERGWKSLMMLPLDHAFAHTVGLYIFMKKGMTMYFVDSQGGMAAAIRNLPSNLKEVNPNFLIIVPALSGNFMKKMIQGVSEKGGLIKAIFNAGIKAGAARAGNGFHKPSFWTRLCNFLPWAIANALIFPKLRAVFGNSINYSVGGGAMLEMKQQEFFNAIGAPIYQGYGLTENAPIISSNSGARHKFGTSGPTVPNLEVKIMKDLNTECAIGEMGQIVTRGDSVMKGYYKNPEATAETLIDGWLWTGDLGWLDEDGFLSVTGRAKALLIAPDGEKFSPEVIEEAICNTSRLINQIMVYNDHCKFTSAVITLNAPELKAALKGAGISATANDAELDKIIGIIKEDLFAYTKNSEYTANIPPQWRPTSFAIVPGAFDENNGLLNATMKLVRHKVRDMFHSRIDEMYAAGSANPMLPGNREALREILKS